MNEITRIQKLRIKTAYLWGLGIGITITALQLTPSATKSGDKYMVTTILGAVVLLLAGVMTWYVRRQEVAFGRAQNLDTLTDKNTHEHR
jgi:hypothetical protein